MLLRPYGTFTGGISLPDEKDATIGEPIRPCPSLTVLRVPLAACGGESASPVAQGGDRVRAGQRIAEARGPDALDVFAPLDGTVSGIVPVSVAGRYGPVTVPAVELKELSDPPSIRPVEPTYEWFASDAASLRNRLAEGGLSTHGLPAEPLSRWIDRAVAARCDVLVANVMEQEPYVTAVHSLMVEHGLAVVRGLALLGRAIGASKVFLVADRRRTAHYRRTAGPARMYNIEQLALSEKYPTGADVILAKILTRRETPPGGRTTDVAVAVTDAATCFAAYRWAACGVHCTGRVVTVSGERAPARGNWFVPFGASCHALAGPAGQAEGLVLHGGPMTGRRCPEDMIIGPGSNAVLVIDPPPLPVPGPCVRCGWCMDHCPARLDVPALNDAFELGHVDRARRLGSRACVECGVCSYVCPSRLPLTYRVIRLNRAARGGRTGAERS